MLRMDYVIENYFDVYVYTTNHTYINPNIVK